MDEEKFGHLGTDERVEVRTRKSDFENNVLGGCVIFSIASVAQLAAVAIPLLVYRSIHTISELGGALSIAVTTGIVIGSIFSASNLAGLFGSLAGLVPACTFLWLRLRDAVTGIPGIEGMEPAEYPDFYALLIPTVYFVLPSAIFCASFYLRAKTKRSMP